MQGLSVSARTIVILAALVVLVAGLKTAAPILNPFLLSGFIAVIAAPPMYWLHHRGLPWGLSLLAVVLGIVVFAMAMVLVVGTSVDDFLARLPEYQQRLKAETGSLFSLLSSWGIDVDRSGLAKHFDPGAAINLVGKTLAGFGNVLTNGFLILLTVIFLLLEAATLPVKIRTISDDPEQSLDRWHTIALNVQRYVELKAIVSIGTGVLVALWLWILGVDFPLVWGVLAFLLNFVPNIGSIIAAVPAMLLAFVQLGIGSAALTGLGYLVVNTLMGNVIEPRYMGKGLGLSTLVVFLSLVFWGWILGPVGMLLSVPLTMTAKIVLEAHDDSRWIAVLLGPGHSESEETDKEADSKQA
ncbi:MAG: AI-2E family transporter [Gammaproteobacteria bacterium]